MEEKKERIRKNAHNRTIRDKINKFDIKSLNVNLRKNNKILFELKDVYFSNYGYKKFKID